jgi:broad specificity phosphatase PhoE
VSGTVISNVDNSVELYLVRHGESEANVRHIFANQVEGQPLTERGRAQARALSSRLAVALGDRTPSSLRTSPVLRARQTAAILSTRLDLPVLPPCRALTEFDVGVFEGSCDPDHWDRFDELIRDWLLDDQFDRRIPGGESYRDIEARFVPFVHDLVADSGPGDVHVLVTHGGLLRCMVPQVASNVDGRFAYHHELATTAWVHLSARDGDLVCRSWGDLDFDDGRAGP